MEEEKKQTLKLVFVLIVLLIITGLVIWFVYFRDNNSKKNNSVEDVIEITSESKNLEIDYSDEEQKESYEEFNARINLLDLSIAGSGAYEERNVIKINKEGTYYFYGEHENANIICAKAADELLTIADINASFVLGKIGNTVFISGRSIGDINVQIILEKLGGGGHITLAGAQLEDVSIEDAKQELLTRIEEYFAEIE